MGFNINLDKLQCDHDQHVKLFKRLAKKAIYRTHKRVDHKLGSCLIYTGMCDRPTVSIYKVNYRAASLYQEQVLGHDHVPGMIWVNTCGNVMCIHHRERVTWSEHHKRAYIPNERRALAASASSRARSPHSREDVVRVHELRAEGKGIAEIHRITGIPKSTVSDFINRRAWADAVPGSFNGITHAVAQLLGARA